MDTTVQEKNITHPTECEADGHGAGRRIRMVKHHGSRLPRAIRGGATWR